MSQLDVAGAQSLHRSFALLRLIAAHSNTGLRLSEVVKKSSLSRSTTYRMLQALDREGLVMFDAATEKYHLGPEAFILGVAAEERFGIHSAGLSSLSTLALETQDTAMLMIRRGTHSVCVGREEGTYPIRTHMAHPGHRSPLGIGAASLAMLSALPDEEVEWVLQRNAEEIRNYPAFSIASLREMVEETRERGFAVNPGLIFSESWAVGVAVVRPGGGSDAGLSLAGVASRIEGRVPEIAAILGVEARRLSDRLYRNGRTLLQACSA